MDVQAQGGPSRPPVPTRRSGAAYAIALLMVLTTVSWRQGSLYAGGVDPIVAAKALVAIIAVCVAWTAAGKQSATVRVRTLPFWFLLGFLALSCLGAWAGGTLVPSATLAFRVVMLAATVVLLVKAYDVAEACWAIFAAFITVALVASVTGLPSLASGRLSGGVPPIHANEVAALSGFGLIALLWLVLQQRAAALHRVLLVVMLATLWFSGSRTSLMAVMVAVVVMLTQVRRLSPPATVGAVAMACGLASVLVGTDLLGSFFGRGGAESLSTLGSRTIAWSAAFDFSDDGWVRMFGAGLSTKQVPVAGQYWQTQVLDSSWISALVQAGRVGALVLLVWAVWTIAVGFSGDRHRRMLFGGLLAYVLVRSVLESGLVDSSPPFVVFFLVGVAGGRVPRPLLPTAPTAGPRRSERAAVVS